MRPVASLLLALAAVGPASAGVEGPYALDIHVTPLGYVSCAMPIADPNLTCGNLNPNGIPTSNFYWAWVVISGVPDPDGIRSVSFGIDHSVTDVAWSLCNGGSEVTDGAWPNGGGGITVTWPDDCYVVTDNADGITRLGSFVIGNDQTSLLTLRDHPAIGEARATDCTGATTEICAERLGVGDSMVNGTQGFIVCGSACVTPTEESTWGSVKALYGD